MPVVLAQPESNTKTSQLPAGSRGVGFGDAVGHSAGARRLRIHEPAFDLPSSATMQDPTPRTEQREAPGRLNTVLAVAVGLLLLIVLGSALPELRMKPGTDSGLMSLFTDTFARPETTPWSSEAKEGPFGLTRFWLLAIWGCLTFCVVYAIISPTYRKALLGAVATTLLLTFVLMRVLENQEARQAESSAMGAPPQEELQFAQAEPPVPPDMEVRNWMVWVVTGAGGLAIAGLGLFLLNRVNWGRSDTSELIRREAGEAIAALDSGHDVGDTIERCYLNMVQCLEETRRVRRSQSMTPREFEQRLSELGMHSRPVRRLSALFERVRFGDRPASARDRQEASDCLQQIRDSRPPPSEASLTRGSGPTAALDV